MSIVSRHKPPDSRIERKIITGMITSDNFLQQIQTIYREDSLKLKYTKTIAKWCLDYYKEFKLAPQRHIEDLFHKRTKINFPPDQADEIADFLEDISEEYEHSKNLNVELLLQDTENHFRLSSLDNLKVNLSKSLISGKVEEGESLVKGYERVVRQTTKGVDPFRDKDAIIDAFGDKDQQDKILKFPGILGQTIGDLERGHLVCFVANTGVGKSWWLLQTCWWAMMMGYDCLFISYEMSHKKITTRTYQWATGLVLPRHAGTLYIPRFDCLSNVQDTCNLRYRENKIGLLDKTGQVFSPKDYPKDYKPCTACKKHCTQDYITTTYKESERSALTLEKALKTKVKFEKYQKRAGRFKVVQFPSGSQSVDDLRVYLQNLEDYENFIPSVLVTDYAKKMKPSRWNQEKRHNISDIFQEHKGLAQEKNILVATGHQGNTVRDGKDLKSGNWADDIGGLHECDISIMINQSPEDKKLGFYRMFPGKVRDDEFNTLDQVRVLHDLRIGKPYIDSRIIRG